MVFPWDSMSSGLTAVLYDTSHTYHLKRILSSGFRPKFSAAFCNYFSQMQNMFFWIFTFALQFTILSLIITGIKMQPGAQGSCYT